MSRKKIILMILIGLAGMAIGYFVSLYTSKNTVKNNTAPMMYVARCGFHFKGENCGEQARAVIFQASDEFLSYTNNWAVGRVDNYKMYMSCFGPDDEKFIDGTFSSLTIAVAGPKLAEAYDIAKQLLADFSTHIAEQGGSVSHCIEK